MKPQPPKYTALYKVFYIYNDKEIEICQKEGNNKATLYKEIKAIATAEQPIVWAIYDRCGVCVSGGVANSIRGVGAVWAAERCVRLAKCIFKPPKERVGGNKISLHARERKNKGKPCKSKGV